MADQGVPKSSSTLESQSHNHTHTHPIQVLQTIAYCVFDREFDFFDSHEWGCSSCHFCLRAPGLQSPSEPLMAVRMQHAAAQFARLRLMPVDLLLQGQVTTDLDLSDPLAADPVMEGIESPHKKHDTWPVAESPAPMSTLSGAAMPGPRADNARDRIDSAAVLSPPSPLPAQPSADMEQPVPGDCSVGLDAAAERACVEDQAIGLAVSSVPSNGIYGLIRDAASADPPLQCPSDPRGPIEVKQLQPPLDAEPGAAAIVPVDRKCGGCLQTLTAGRIDCPMYDTATGEVARVGALGRNEWTSSLQDDVVSVPVTAATGVDLGLPTLPPVVLVSVPSWLGSGI